MTLPGIPEQFEWTSETWGAALRCRPLAAYAPHLFTTRRAMLGSPGDLERLAAAVGARQVAMARQVHGRDVIVVRDGPPRAIGDEQRHAVGGANRDGHVTAARHARVCFGSIIGNAIAVAHDDNVPPVDLPGHGHLACTDGGGQSLQVAR